MTAAISSVVCGGAQITWLRAALALGGEATLGGAVAGADGDEQGGREMHGTLDVALRVLDQQVVDAAGRRCGRVDDVEFEGGPGEPTRIAALLVGVDHLLPRLPVPLRIPARLTQGWGDERSVRVPWDEVRAVTHVVRLERRAEEYGLGRGGDRARRLVGRLPRAG